MKQEYRYDKRTKTALHMSLCCMVGWIAGLAQLPLDFLLEMKGRFIKRQLHTTFDGMKSCGLNGRTFQPTTKVN